MPLKFPPRVYSAYKGFVDRMSHESHLDIDCNVSVIYCSSSSGNKVDLLSGTNMYTTVVVSDWCITNLAQGWWVWIQSIAGIFRGCWFPLLFFDATSLQKMEKQGRRTMHGEVNS